MELRQQALGARSGKRALNVSRAADSSSLLEITALQDEVYPGTASVGTVDVDVSTLDESLGDVSIPLRSLLKADVQGYELEVLKGGASTLQKLGWIYLEVSFVELYAGQPLAHQVVNYLAERGFHVADTSEPSRVGGRTIQIDLLFENDHLAADG